MNTLRELSTRRSTAWAVLGGVILLALVVGAVAGHHAPAAPTASAAPGALTTMPDVRGELVSVAVPALQAQFPGAQVVVAGSDPNTAAAEPIGGTYPAAGALTANAGVITLYPAAPTVTTLPAPTAVPTTTVDTPAPDIGSGGSSSSGGGGVYVPHPHAHVCVGGRHVHVCS